MISEFHVPSSVKWDTTETTATIDGTAPGKVSTTVTYEDSGTTLVLGVTSDFAAPGTVSLYQV